MPVFDYDLNPAEECSLIERQERCSRAIKTLIKAIVMRLLICALLIWVVIRSDVDLWVTGLLILVMVINMTGAFPLAAELKKRRQEWKVLLSEEE